MKHWLRAVGGFGWRVVVSVSSFYGCAFVGESLQHLRGSYYTPTSWAISLALCFFTFCLFAMGLAIAFQMSTLYRRHTLVAGASFLYTTTTLYWCGAFFGPLERPYRLAWIICCGLAGLTAPWLLEKTMMRLLRPSTYRLVD